MTQAECAVHARRNVTAESMVAEAGNETIRKNGAKVRSERAHPVYDGKPPGCIASSDEASDGPAFLLETDVLVVGYNIVLLELMVLKSCSDSKRRKTIPIHTSDRRSNMCSL